MQWWWIRATALPLRVPVPLSAHRRASKDAHPSVENATSPCLPEAPVHTWTFSQTYQLTTQNGVLITTSMIKMSEDRKPVVEGSKCAWTCGGRVCSRTVIKANKWGISWIFKAHLPQKRPFVPPDCIMKCFEVSCWIQIYLWSRRLQRESHQK